MIISRARWVLAGVMALIVCGIGVYILFSRKNSKEEILVEVIEETVSEEVLVPSPYEVIGTSVEGRMIEVFRFGTGDKHLFFVGGIHGGYEWNSVVLAYSAIDYFIANPQTIPEDITVHLIPSLNPDGVFAVVGKEGKFSTGDIPSDSKAIGRFNARGVDLNRNFDCKWKSESMWRGKVVSAGTQAFSEPEAVALRDYVAKYIPSAVVFWHSQANAVYASECTEGVLPETLTLMDTYAKSAGYTSISSFDAYPVTGDAEGWLASIGIPAITVELATHEGVEWEKNRIGIEAVIKEFSKRSTP
jgi:g-D-glutamyl-meso-diaminopimelate peptidase